MQTKRSFRTNFSTQLCYCAPNYNVPYHRQPFYSTIQAFLFPALIPYMLNLRTTDKEEMDKQNEETKEYDM